MPLKDNLKSAREAAGLKQGQLAEKAGVSQQLISQLERGEVTRTKLLPEIATALGVAASDLDPIYLPAKGARPARQPEPRSPEIPVYASAQGGPGEIIVNFDPIDHLIRADPLQRDGYAVYVVGDSMAPALEQGNLALVNPHQPPRPGDDVLLYREENGETAAAVKRLVRSTADSWIVEQFNPPKKMTLHKKHWTRCDVIVGKYYRR